MRRRLGHLKLIVSFMLVWFMAVGLLSYFPAQASAAASLLEPETTTPLAKDPDRIDGSKVVIVGTGQDSKDYVPPPPTYFKVRNSFQRATATINVTYSGFTPQAQASFQYAVDIWASLVTSPVPITISAQFTDLGGPDGTGSIILGSTSAHSLYQNFSGAPQSNTFYPVSLANALHGSDLDSGGPDMDASFNSNSNVNWYFRANGDTSATPAGQSDFTSVVLHEIGHGLGFTGYLDYDTGTGKGSFNHVAILDRFIQNGSGQTLVNAFSSGTTQLGSQLVSDNLFFNGTNANASNGGSQVKLYDPTTWRGGSSIYHLGENFNGTGSALMTWSINNGETELSPGPVTLGIFRDLGWSETLPTITLSPTSLPNGTVGLPYNQTLSASGGNSPYTFNITSGSLPPGLFLLTSGLLSGTPTTGGSYSFTVTAKDNYDFTGSQNYTIVIGKANTVTGLNAAPNPVINGNILTLTASVAPASGSGVPTGSVTFFEGATNLGTVPLNGSGVAGLSLTASVLGFHTYTASYAGDSNYNPSSSAAITVLVIDKPTAVTGLPSNITPSKVTLSGTVNPNYSDSNYYFDVSTSPTICPSAPAQSGLGPVSGSTPQPVSQTITGLNSNQIYHYRLVATNAAGTGCGDDATFRTAVDVTKFSLFTQGDLSLTTGGSEITGKIAAGGNATFVSYNLATQQPGFQDNLLVNGNLSLKGGQVKGNALYGGTLSRVGTAFIQGSPIQQANALELVSTKIYNENVAQAWHSQGGLAVSPRYGGYQLNTGNPGTSYFALKGSELFNVNYLSINAPAGATVVLNIDGTNDRLQYMGISLNGGIDRQHVVFNFYEATNLKLNGVQVEGLVWAPKATVDFTNGAIRGTLVANSMEEGSARFEYFAYQGGLPL